MVKIGTVQADRAAQELPSLVAPISRGLNAAVERLSVLEHSCLRQGDAVQAPDLETALARWDVTACNIHYYTDGIRAWHALSRPVG